MKLFKILPYIVVPSLLMTTAFMVYLIIRENWSIEISTYIIFLFTAIYILVFERVIPLKQDWSVQKSSLWVDAKHFIFSATLFDALGKTASLSFVLYLQRFIFEPYDLWTDLPFLLTFTLANVIGELLPYLYHRISHVGNKNSAISLFLWKVHAIHHLPTSLNWFKTNWIHPINLFINTVFKMAPLLLLGFSSDVIFSVGIMNIVIAYVSHANVQTKTGPLDYILVTPQIHHLHHSLHLHEAKNFGNIIPFWDLVFGTYYNRKGEVDQVGTIKSHIIYPKKENYIRQLIFPFNQIFKDCC